jgi:hypothetical protein
MMLRASAYLSAPGGSHFPQLLEREFYRSIKTSNGTKKSTGLRRLDAMNDLFFATLDRCRLVPQSVMDIGVSSGVTTVEWLREFDRRGLPVTMIATDLVMSVDLFAIGRYMRVLTEKNGHLLQIEMFGSGIRTFLRRRDYLTGGVVWRKALCYLARPLLKMATHEGTYLLVSPALRDQDRIKLFDDDLLAPNPPQFARCADVVRVANLVQPIYFSDDQIRQAVENIRERCRGEGSLVVVCRNAGTNLEGSILRMTGQRQFSVEARLGRGSEVEHHFTAVHEAPLKKAG